MFRRKSVRVISSATTRNGDLAQVRELDCVVDQVDENLPQPQRITHQKRWSIFCHREDQRNALVLRLLPDDVKQDCAERHAARKR